MRRAAERRGYDVDLHCWAYCIYTTPDDFNALHAGSGEACDYLAMKAQVLADLAGGDGFSLGDLSLSWREWPDIDVSCLFDWFS